MGQNYNKLSGKSCIDSSDFADTKDYNHVWRMMDRYAKGDLYKTRTWQLQNITKLIEICQEKVGIRSENNIATPLILLYFGVTSHRLYHIFSADMEFDDYRTIYYWRNAASHRSTFAESLELFHGM